MMQIALLYTLFAGIATVVNLLSQEVVDRLWPFDYRLAVAIFVGTGTGLVVKYLLDKRYIFKFQTENLKHDSQLFVRYTLMGLITTLIFWGFEWGFDAIFETKTMRYAGAVIGLAIGYLSKYQLDKRYVFTKP